jgi:transcriptional regulator with XRE-family HTH domain
MAQHFGERLQRLRAERGWTVYEAAKRAGMSSQLLYKLERAAALGRISGVTLRKLAQVYQVTVDYLLHDVADSDDEDDVQAA